MQINFLIRKEVIEEMTTEEFEALEMAQDGEIKLYRLRPLICRFMVDENGKQIAHEQALKTSGKMKMKEMQSFIEQFFKATQEAAVPKANGSPLKSPIEAEQAGSPSQVG